MCITILLSTYNGSAYLQEQLASIQQQSFVDWVLLVRDDGSEDDTIHILTQAIAQDERIQLLPSQGNVGVIESFSLLAAAGLQMFPNTNYFMFADQDDVWLPFKMSDTLDVMQTLALEHEHVLVHTDLRVVDERLNQIAPSFMQFQHIHHEEDYALNVLLVQNFVTGCTVMVNRALLSTALPVPGGAMMHDWWLALCAANMGKIGFVDKATMLYRQHQTNSVGAKGAWGSVRQLLSSTKVGTLRFQRFQKIQSQAKSLLTFLREQGHTKDSSLVADFVSIEHQTFFQRLYHMKRLHIQPQFYLRTWAFWFDLFQSKRRNK